MRGCGPGVTWNTGQEQEQFIGGVHVANRYRLSARSPVRVTGLNTLETAIQTIIIRLCAGFSIPDQPVSHRHEKKGNRNGLVLTRYSAGQGLSDLAREFG